MDITTVSLFAWQRSHGSSKEEEKLLQPLEMEGTTTPGTLNPSFAFSFSTNAYAQMVPPVLYRHRDRLVFASLDITVTKLMSGL